DPCAVPRLAPGRWDKAPPLDKWEAGDMPVRSTGLTGRQRCTAECSTFSLRQLTGFLTGSQFCLRPCGQKLRQRVVLERVPAPLAGDVFEFAKPCRELAVGSAQGFLRIDAVIQRELAD